MTKVLFYDIETAPNLGYIWGQYEQNVLSHVREWYILCVSFRWEGSKKTECVSLPDFPVAYKKDPENDKLVVQKMWDLFEEADVIVAHNGDHFDYRKASARFIYHDMGPPAKPQSVDTLKWARKHFMFNSNKRGDLGQHLGLGNKEATGGFKLWAGCMRGDAKSWRTMIKYAKQDVTLLQKVYNKLRPWSTNHPNMNTVDGKKDACPTCGSNQLISRGSYRTKVSTFKRLSCKACGAFCRSRKSTSSPTNLTT